MPINPKRCRVCGKTKLPTQFYKHPNTADGYDTRCKVCTGESRKRAEVAVSKRAAVLDPSGGKTCPKCKKWKPYNEFQRRSYSKDKCQNYCKKCLNSYNTAWAKRNPSKYTANNVNRRARLLGAEGRATERHIRRIQRFDCIYCEAEIDGDGEIDHVIPLAKKGTNWDYNLVHSCRHCNASKHDTMPREWLEQRGIDIDDVKFRYRVQHKLSLDAETPYDDKTDNHS